MTVFVTQPKLNIASMTSNFWPGKVIKGAVLLYQDMLYFSYLWIQRFWVWRLKQNLDFLTLEI